MQPPRFEGYQCWRNERIADVINTEAVAIDVANFLATHVPLHRIRYEDAPSPISDTSEEGLLDELLSRGKGNLHTFVVVLGIPGTGKSHLIRWLKERYATINRGTGGRDEVLLIERARSSLRGTLEQILTQITAIPRLDNKTLRDQLDKLRQATVELSRDEELRDTILNELQVAAKAYGSEIRQTQPSEETQRERLERVRIQPNIEKFLLDYKVRERLKQAGGPIDQLVRFLSSGNTSRAGSDAPPEFKPEHFVFDARTRMAIRDEGGYREAKQLADDLQNKPELRDVLARYLNRLITRAVSGATKLSADDLKQMFNEVRRHLRKQGRNLVLFVEDITAFTGLDAALVDVLATQHTGEGNKDFCRLTSVIGSTDSYYDERFPDNMKERVTHRMTLNAEGRDRGESDLLRDGDVLASFAARYLNAMRLTQDDLNRWLGQGAHPADLPNACFTCPFRQPCHASFGYIAPANAAADEQQHVGLYPFNKNALERMYGSIDTSKFSRTPRSLLLHVLQYVLINHGPKVRAGLFPPRPRDVGHAFGVPSLQKPGQERTITMQGGANVDRLQSLVRFWGDGTVDAAIAKDGQRLVGGISEGVFQAFRLPFIEGEVTSQLVQPVVVPVVLPAVDETKPMTDPQSEVDRQPKVVEPAPVIAGSTPAIDIPPPPPTQVVSPIIRDIGQWYQEGRLERYNELATGLANTFKSFIDWEAHGVSPAQVAERCTAQRFVIQDQAGQPKVGDYLKFDRSLELYEVLLAIASLNEGIAMNREGALGGHLLKLGNWLYTHEPEIVEFVRRPHGQVAEPRPLVDVLLIDCLLVEWLRGALRPEHGAAPKLLAELVAVCARSEQFPMEAGREWEQHMATAERVRGKPWQALMRRLNVNDVRTSRARLLSTLSRAQGTSRDVRFIDAAAGLETIEQFMAGSWGLPSLPRPADNWSPTWIAGLEIYEAFRQYLPEVLRIEREELGRRTARFDELLGQDAPDEVFAAIVAFVRALEDHRLGHDLPRRPPMDAAELEDARAELRGITGERRAAAFALALSGAEALLGNVQRYLEYLEAVAKQLESTTRENAARERALAATVAAVSAQDEADQLFNELDSMLTRAASTAVRKEVAA